MDGEKGEIEKLFRTIFHMHISCVRRECERRGIDNPGHPLILFLLRNEAENKAVSQKEIAKSLGLRPPTVAIAIKRMEKAGLIRKTPDKSDLRFNRITLTEKGRQTVDGSKAVFDYIDDIMFNGLTDTEYRQLRETFNRIISNLESIGAHPCGCMQEFCSENSDKTKGNE
jgi:DNA-binding MarR family transcriptional regulator